MSRIEIRKTMTFILAPKKKHTAINLRKNVQDLFEKNYKTPMSKVKKELNQRRDTPRSGRGKQHRQDVTSF